MTKVVQAMWLPGLILRVEDQEWETGGRLGCEARVDQRNFHGFFLREMGKIKPDSCRALYVHIYIYTLYVYIYIYHISISYIYYV